MTPKRIGPNEARLRAAMHTYECPWCGTHATPGETRQHLDVAEFVYGSKDNPKDVRRNPLVCLECFGVGGFDDFAGDLGTFESA